MQEAASGTPPEDDGTRATQFHATALWTQAPVGLCELALDGRFVQTNPALCQLLGRSGAELLATTLFDLIHPADMLSTIVALAHVVSTSQLAASFTRYLHRDGSTIWAHCSLLRSDDAFGQPRSVLVVMIDLGAHTLVEQLRQAEAAREQAETALRETTARLQITLEATEIATWEWNLQTNQVHWNEWHFLLLGMQPSNEPIGPETFFDHVHPNDRAVVRDQLARAVRDHSIFEAEFCAVRDDGSLRWMHGYGQAVEIVDGQVVRLSGVMRDITARKQAEAALRRSNEELEARIAERTDELVRLHAVRQELLRKLVTTQEAERRRIAHQLHESLGQFLSALSLRLALLQCHKDANPAMLAELEQLQTLLMQVEGELDRLTMELRPPALDDVGLGTALTRYVQDWTHTTAIPVDVVVRGFDGEHLPSVIETTAYRIVQEALANVRLHAQASLVSLIVERRPAELRVMIADNGSGFDADARMMERQEGQSLGLVGMQERAQLVGGTVMIESGLGTGTTVYLRVPLPQPLERRYSYSSRPLDGRSEA